MKAISCLQLMLLSDIIFLGLDELFIVTLPTFFFFCSPTMNFKMPENHWRISETYFRNNNKFKSPLEILWFLSDFVSSKAASSQPCFHSQHSCTVHLKLGKAQHLPFFSSPSFLEKRQPRV